MFEESQKTGKPFVYFNEDKTIHKIYLEDILYLEADNNYTNICCVLGKNTTSTQNLKKLEDVLLKYPYFIRISRSVIINTNYLSTFDRTNKKCMLFADSKSYNLKVSREKLKDFDRLL